MFCPYTYNNIQYGGNAVSLNNASFINKDVFQIAHTDDAACTLLANKLISWLPATPREYVILCIGTDRSTGDSLGPLTGTFLAEYNPLNITIYGTLNEPVHAKNLSCYIHKIQQQHIHPFIIVIDACLGKHKSIGSIITGKGPIKPGAALKKTLPTVGDVHLTGVVNLGGFMEFSVLQNTRLSIVVDIAKILAVTLNQVDKSLRTHKMISAMIQKSPSTYEV